MRSLIGVSLLLSSVMLSVPGAAHAATRVFPVHPERSKMLPGNRREAVLADLETILSGPASPTSIATTPYLSKRDGLCQRDVVHLGYERKDGKPDGPVTPRGISMLSREFHHLGYAKERTHEDWKEACENLTGKDAYWARSEDDTMASAALGTLAYAVANVGDAVVDCAELDRVESGTACASEFRAAAAEVNWAWKFNCPAQPDGRQPGCYSFSTIKYDFSITVTSSRFAGAKASIAIKMQYAQIIVT